MKPAVDSVLPVTSPKITKRCWRETDSTPRGPRDAPQGTNLLSYSLLASLLSLYLFDSVARETNPRRGGSKAARAFSNRRLQLKHHSRGLASGKCRWLDRPVRENPQILKAGCLTACAASTSLATSEYCIGTERAFSHNRRGFHLPIHRSKQ